MILEEDFQILPDTLKHLPRIEQFVTTAENCDIYSLGCYIILSIPTFSRYHKRVVIGGSSHAWIVSKKFKERVALTPDEKLIYNHDSFYINNSMLYPYKEPIIVQPHPISENMLASWGKPYTPEWLRIIILEQVTARAIKLHGADKDGTKLYRNFHKCSDSGGWPVVLILIVLNIIICNYFTYKLKNS